MKISVIIIQYNINKELVKVTKDCISSLMFSLYSHEHEIIVVDNNSPIQDDEIKSLADIYIQRDKNNSVAQSFNEGVAKSSGDIILHADNDVLVSQRWGDKMVDTFNRDKDCSIVGFALAETGDDLLIDIGDEKVNGMPAGCLFAMKRNVFDTLNGFDEKFKICYFDDSDFLLRAIKKGFKIKMCYNNRVFHYLSKTTRSPGYKDKLHEAREYNHKYFLEKHGGECGAEWEKARNSFKLRA